MEEHGELLPSLAVRSCVLEVKSWSDNNVSVNPYLTNVILCSDKKGQGLQAQLSPPEVQILAEEKADFSWQLSQGRVPTVPLCRLPLPSGRRGRDGGGVLCCLKVWAGPVGGPGEDCGAWQETAASCSLWPPSPPLSDPSQVS